MHITKIVKIIAKSALLTLGLQTAAFAQTYPTRPVTIIVPFAPGGTTDTSARITANALAKRTGGTFVVENAPGAGATLGAAKVAKSAADGYTLLWASSSLAITPHIFKNLQYDPVTSFAPIGAVAEQPYVLAVNASREFQNVGQLIAKAKSAPGTLNFSSTGLGSSTHLVAELFMGESGINAVHIPYNGGAPAIAALVAGDTDFMFDTPTTIVPLVKSGRLKALAVTGDDRWRDLPDVPTLEEADLSKIDATAWMGLAAPAGTPGQILDDLNTALNDVLGERAAQEALERVGLKAIPSSEAEFGQRISNQTVQWGELVKKANISTK